MEYYTNSLDGSNISVLESLRLTLKEAPTSIVIIFLTLIIGGFVTHLYCYHLVVIVWKGMSTYESKKSHFKDYQIDNPYQLGHKRCYMLCRVRPNKFFNFREDEPLKVNDSDRRCSYKVVTKNAKGVKNVVAK